MLFLTLQSLHTYSPPQFILFWVNSTHPLAISFNIMSLQKTSLTLQSRFGHPILCFYRTLYSAFMILVSVAINYSFDYLFNAYFSPHTLSA